MKNIYNLINGKKTYIIGLLMISLGLLQENGDLVIQGFGILFLRHGVAKIEK